MNPPVLNPQEMAVFAALPEHKKRAALKRAFNILSAMAEKQLIYIDKWKSEKDHAKQAKHQYIFGAIEGFWENVAFASYLEKTVFANLAFYPVRTCMEAFMQFSYFCKRTPSEQDDIAIKELLWFTVSFYKREKANGMNGAQYADFYKSYARTLLLPDIDTIKDSDSRLKPFPNMHLLCKEYNPAQGNTFYFMYHHFSEAVHGRILQRIIRERATDLQEYRRAIMMLFLFCEDILVLLDENFLNSMFQEDVKKAIFSANQALKNSLENPVHRFFKRFFK